MILKVIEVVNLFSKQSFMLEEIINLNRQMKIFEMNNAHEKIFKTAPLYHQLKNLTLLNSPPVISVDQQQNRTSELIAGSSHSYTVDELINYKGEDRVEITDMDRKFYRDINRCFKATNSNAPETEYELGFIRVGPSGL